MEDGAGRAAWEKAQGELSAGSLEWYRNRLEDQEFQRTYPEAHAALKVSVDKALRQSQQTLDRPSDVRSEAQVSWDRRMGVTMAADGKPQLPSDLASAIERSVQEADPHEVAQALTNIGRSYKDDYAAATRLLAQTGSKVDAARLSAAALSQLAIFADHLARHQQNRPK
jgi:hypothetical protein